MLFNKALVKIWEDYSYQKQAMFAFIKSNKWGEARKFAIIRELKPEEDRKPTQFVRK